MYKGRTPKILNSLAALVAMSMLVACKIASAASTLIFSYPNGFSGAGVRFRLPPADSSPVPISR